MNQQKITTGVLAFVVFAFGAVIAMNVKDTNKFKNLFGKPESSNNWKWEDDWKDNDIQPKVEVPPVPKPKEQVPDQQIVAISYADAIQKSNEMGRPVLVYLTTKSCVFCEKMQKTTLKDEKVKNLMKNYIFVEVDVDKNRAVATKFEITQLPSSVITNGKEEKLKFDFGYKAPEFYANWLNNPELFNQQKGDKVIPQNKPAPKVLPYRRDSKSPPKSNLPPIED